MTENEIVGIITAVDAELLPFLEELDSPSITERSMLKIYFGSINGKNLAAVCCGVGRTNASIAAQLLISEYNVKSIIVSGTAGAMDEKVNIGDIVIAECAYYHDLEDYILSDFHPYLQRPCFHMDRNMLDACRQAVAKGDITGNVFFGRLITGDKFIDSSNREELIKRYHPLSADMETAAFAHVCYVNQVPFFCARGISDNASGSGLSEFEKNAHMASRRAFEAVKAVLPLI